MTVSSTGSNHVRLKKKVSSPKKFFIELDNSPGSVTIIFNKCHVLLKPATLHQVTDKKMTATIQKNLVRNHFLNLPISIAVSRVIIRFICSILTFQVSSLMV